MYITGNHALTINLDCDALVLSIMTVVVQQFARVNSIQYVRRYKEAHILLLANVAFQHWQKVY